VYAGEKLLPFAGMKPGEYRHVISPTLQEAGISVLKIKLLGC